MPIILEKITKVFGEPPANVLKGISVKIDDGEFVSITGRSGSGKSTLLYIMSTLDTPTRGSVFYDAQNVQALSDKAVHVLRNMNIGFVFQFHYLLPDLTVLENVLMPAYKTGRAKERMPHAMKLLDQFGLRDRLSHYPKQISGGERQRVAIARAMVMEPRYLFTDEPTGSLDTTNGDKVMEILKNFHRDRKGTVVMVTHDPDYAALAKRQIHLADGNIV